MVLAHVLDAWTRADDRSGPVFDRLKFVGGLAAPAFLMLAGLSLVLAAHRVSGRRGDRTDGAEVVWRRSWRILGLAFLFRLQSFVLGFGAPVGLLKVDILNVLGASMVAAAALWGALSQTALRITVFVVLSVAMVMAAPFTTAADLASMPAPLRWYLQPVPGFSSFSLLPWTAFLLAGAVVGELLAWAREADRMPRTQMGLLVVSAVGVAIAAWAGEQPSLYPPGVSTYWGPSPAFFLLRLALVVLLLPAAWLHERVWYGPAGMTVDDADSGLRALLRRAWRAVDRRLCHLGQASLFAYWVHIELVYGIVAIPLRRVLPLWLVLVATVALCAALERMAGHWERWRARRRMTMAPIPARGGA